MLSCAICLDQLTCPVVLPCGHVYCRECVLRNVRKDISSHRCPTCRQTYRIVNVKPSDIPSCLRSHVFSADTGCPPADVDLPFRDPADIEAENELLRLSGTMWRKRAEAHAAATINILKLACTTKDYALQLKKERDELQLQYNALKEQMESEGLGALSMDGFAAAIPPLTPTISLTRLE